MRYWILLLFLALIVEVGSSHAQAPNTATADTIRIGIIPMSKSMEPLSDILTADLSSKPGLVILERAQMQKIAQEQNLSLLSSAQKSDYLKLGQILGADGLILLDLEQSTTVTNQLAVRLIAVKPGVLLLSKSFSWPLDKPVEWVSGLSPVLTPYYSKLSVLPRDAIPLSILNLRSAVQSPTAHELEHQLTLMAIERFSHEKQVFVLERRNLSLAASEKEKKDLDDSAFWNGNYLLEGTIDRDGVNPSTVTLHARLVPPKGAEPVTFEVQGSRTNLASLVGPLAQKVLATLKLASGPGEWSARAEADRYLAEANWAIKWGAAAEAASAADSAWALGRQDLDTATARIQARMVEFGRFVYDGVTPVPAYKYPLLSEQQEFYLRFSKSYSFPSNEVPEDWIKLGISTLDKGGQLLRSALEGERFNGLLPSDLKELRAQCRNMQAYLQALPSVAAQYEVGEATASHDSLGGLSDSRNFFNLLARTGYLWQEGPEESVAFYRKLMESKAFHYIHQELWRERRKLLMASAAWTIKDKEAIPAVWRKFREELKGSPDFHLQLEGLALETLEEEDMKARDSKFEKLVQTLIAHGPEMAVENGETLYMGWNVEELMPPFGNLVDIYRTNYGPALGRLNQEFWAKTKPRLDAMAKQRKRMDVLRNNVLLPGQDYSLLFLPYTMSDAEKEELKPLLEGYAMFLTNRSKTNLPTPERDGVRLALMHINQLQRVIHTAPAVSKPGQVVSRPVAEPESATRPTLLLTPRRKGSESTLSATAKWIPLPAAGLSLKKPKEELKSLQIISSRMVGSNLFLHVRADWTYITNRVILTDKDGKESDWSNESSYTKFALAMLKPGSTNWQFMICPDEPDPGPVVPGFLIRKSDACLFQNSIYVARANTLLIGDLSNGKWKTNSAQWDRVPRFFVVANHLYAATEGVIVELLQGGEETRILASVRRRPAASLLDNLERLGPYLFEGPDHKLRAVVDYGIYTWTGKDWEKLSRFDKPGRLELLDGSLFLRADGRQLELYAFTTNDTKPTLLFSKPGIESSLDLQPERQTTDSDKALFSRPGYSQSHYYLLWDPAPSRDQVPGNHLLTLYRYPRSLKKPLVLNLQFPPGILPAQAPNKMGSSRQFKTLQNVEMSFLESEILFIDPESPGVYRLSHSDLPAAFTSETGDSDSASNLLLAEYSKNPGSFFVSSRLKAAFEDKDLGLFIAAQMDPKHSGGIDPKVLSHLDGNHDGILQPAEEEAVLLLSDLVAYYAFMNADLNGNGLLEQEEAKAFPSLRVNNRMGKGAIFKDFAIEVQKMNEARIRGAATRLSPDRGEGPLPFGIKAVVEDYWKSEKRAKKN